MDNSSNKILEDGLQPSFDVMNALREGMIQLELAIIRLERVAHPAQVLVDAQGAAFKAKEAFEGFLLFREQKHYERALKRVSDFDEVVPF